MCVNMAIAIPSAVLVLAAIFSFRQGGKRKDSLPARLYCNSEGRSWHSGTTEAFTTVDHADEAHFGLSNK